MFALYLACRVSASRALLTRDLLRFGFCFIEFEPNRFKVCRAFSLNNLRSTFSFYKFVLNFQLHLKLGSLSALIRAAPCELAFPWASLWTTNIALFCCMAKHLNIFPICRRRLSGASKDSKGPAKQGTRAETRPQSAKFNFSSHYTHTRTHTPTHTSMQIKLFTVEHKN